MELKICHLYPDVMNLSCDRGNVLVLEKRLLSGLEKTLELPESLPAPVEPGQEVGMLVVRHGENVLCRVPVLTADGAERLGLWDLLRALWQPICGR